MHENPYQIQTQTEWEGVSLQPLSLKTYLSALASFVFVAFGVLVMWVLLLMVIPSRWLILPHWVLRGIVASCVLSSPVLGIISAWQTLGLARQKQYADAAHSLDATMVQASEVRVAPNTTQSSPIASPTSRSNSSV